MDSVSDSGAAAADNRFAHLISWEAQLLGWGRRKRSQHVLVVIILSILVPCAWRFAIEPEPLSQNARYLHHIAQMFLWIMPLHSARQTLDEMSFSCILLRLAGCATILFTMLLLPGIAAAGVARDRQTGRLDELVTTTYSSFAIYCAKVIAAALPFWLPCCFVYLLMLPVVASENLTIVSVLKRHDLNL